MEGGGEQEGPIMQTAADIFFWSPPFTGCFVCAVEYEATGSLCCLRRWITGGSCYELMVS